MARAPRHDNVTAILLAVAVTLFLLSLCAIVPPQTYTMWKLQIVATELGHFIAIVALLIFLIALIRRTRSKKATMVFSALAFLCGISSSVIAALWSREVEQRMITAFGDQTPRMMAGASVRRSAFLPTALFSSAESPQVRVVTEEFARRDRGSLDIDVYTREASPARAPIVIVLYSGSWRGGSKADQPQLNRYLAARGYVVAAPNYRLAPRYHFPAQTQDVNDAIDFMKRNAPKFGADSTRIVLIGRSAGGQLALESAYTRKDSAIRGVAAIYAPSDQKWGWDHPTNQRVYKSFVTLSDFLNGDPNRAATAYRNSSPVNFVDSSTVPTLLIHGSRDPLVSVVQSRRLDGALIENHRRHLLLEMPWATHGCDYFFNGPCGQVTTFAVERFLADVTR
jgi:acetyl esterase/lipase